MREAGAKPALHQRAQPWLGTMVETGLLALAHDTGNNADDDGDTPHDSAPDTAMNAAIDAAFAACRRVHLAMSPALPDSDISRFNRAAAGELIRCDPWTIRVLQLATLLQEASNGLFDIAQGSGRFRCEDAQHVRKETRSTQLDAGGIAKGFAVDRMISTLRAHGIKSAYVNAGGDLRVFGELDMPILRRQPNHQPLSTGLTLHQGSFASSMFVAGLSPFHSDALIHPGAQDVFRKTVSVSVAAPRCVFADALTKVVALSGNIHHPALQQFHASAWIHE